MIYMTGSLDNDSWMYDLFYKTRFFAAHRAKKYDGLSCYDDIIQESELGLWVAIKSFDYEKDFDFYRWAQWNISAKIRNFLYEKKRNSEVKLAITNEGRTEEIDGPQATNVVFNQLIIESKHINSREKKILVDNLIYGKTLFETGKELSLSPEGVRKIKNRAILKLQSVY